ncbi:hypothetical protein SAMN05444274_101408 [Mariniphaga anaerophila]|uniref:Radical SAM core domain-containing protein n=1 Tax=Mariniphaga anaerophila TaxID=1484053 RepID=A0A1M4TMY0_9BACT|nr:radical SAM protein [Mariniphaga anaerophila]SHE45849.1 hypothetical protein SAMN05444274_101408 [Mariniphaga anaerophila]
MNPYTTYLNSLVNKNKDNFAGYSSIKWLNPYHETEALQKREELLKKLEDNQLFHDTKPFHHQISEGCRLCGTGTWSCLFITNKCNAGCFYCPASQLKDEIPATQSLTFEVAESYADYINLFGFKGVSFSGGEPLLFFNRTLHFLKTVRKMCSPDIYIWMYTNGILADENKFRQLADAGLNEIRFDIGATGYSLNKLQIAKGIIPHITIEIPAVPEEKERLKAMLPEMIDAGVTNLNLHQLRLTKHNAEKMLARNYTFVPAEQPVVLESELAALEIIDFARANRLKIGINYCSFFFKNRFQSAGFRRILNNTLAPRGSSVSEKGFIREYSENAVTYKTLKLSEEKPAGEFKELLLSQKKCFISEETAAKIHLPDAQTKAEATQLIQEKNPQIPEDERLFRIWQMEHIEKGLREL